VVNVSFIFRVYVILTLLSIYIFLRVIKFLHGSQEITKLIAVGREKLASVPAGGGVVDL
jgi:hypothetical protein